MTDVRLSAGCLDGSWLAAVAAIQVATEGTSSSWGDGVMTRVADIYETYLRASDLPKPVQVQIAEAVVRTFHNQMTGEQQRKIVVSFTGHRRLLICNKTQARAISTVLNSDEIETWPGRTIVLSAGVAPGGKSTVLVSPTAPAEGDDGNH